MLWHQGRRGRAMAESGRAAWACWDQRTDVASAQKAPPGRGDIFPTRAVLAFCVNEVSAPRYVWLWPRRIAGGYYVVDE